jgi:hypothetical protein
LGLDVRDLDAVPQFAQPDRARRAQLLDDILSGRSTLSQQLASSADAQEEMGLRLQKREGIPEGGGRLIQGSVDVQCHLLDWNVYFAESVMIFVCLSIIAIEACPAASVFYMAQRLVAWWAGC